MDYSFDLETLRGFVSDEIFVFLSSINNVDNGPISNVDDPSTGHTSMDALLLVCSQQFEEAIEPKTKRQKFDTSLKTATKKHIFGVPKTEKEVAEARLGAVPAKTLADNSYCIGVWREWRDHRVTVYGDKMPTIEQLSPSELAANLLSFIFEGRKKNGEEFPPKTLHHIVSGIQRHV